MNILIVEDDVCLASNIRESFLSYRFAHRVDMLNSFRDFLYAPNIDSYDIILLDIYLGEKSVNTGIDILSHIRKNNKEIPVIMISSHSEYSFLETAFKKGAHDYIIKPFRNRELQIRIERWFRNYIFCEYYSTHKMVEYYDLEYDLHSLEFSKKGTPLELTKSNKYILLLFLIHNEKLLTQDFLIGKIWGYSEKDSKKNLRIKILRLKSQLEDVGLDSWIQTVRGEGYMLKMNKED